MSDYIMVLLLIAKTQDIYIYTYTCIVCIYLIKYELQK